MHYSPRMKYMSAMTCMWLLMSFILLLNNFLSWEGLVGEWGEEGCLDGAPDFIH